MIADINKLSNYIKKEEVVYQRYHELVEVSNDENQGNRESLLEDLKLTDSIEIYKKDDNYIFEDFADLNTWSTKDDVLLLLQLVGTLICIPRKEAELKELIK